MNKSNENKPYEVAKEEIERSNLILNAMFNAMPDSVFCKDLERRYIECNKSFEGFMTQPKEDILGKTFAEATGQTVDIVKNYTDEDTSVINEGKTIIQEDVSMTYNGEERFYDLIKTPLIKKNADGEDEIFGLLGLMHDVNERYLLIKDLQNVQANLEIALERARFASKAKNEFLSRMSHELLTPMNAIMGLSQVAKLSNDSESIRDYISEIYDNARHLLRLISNLLEVSSGVGALAEVEFSPVKLTENITTQIAQYLDKKQQKLNIEIDEALPKSIVSDEKRIEKVIFHLLTNASKFSHENSEISLNLSLYEETAEGIILRVSVTDNGIGMTTEEIGIVFDMFEQGDGGYTRKYHGTGIGLTLSKYTVESMGGSLSVISEPGKGSTFSFTVPVRR